MGTPWKQDLERRQAGFGDPGLLPNRGMGPSHLRDRCGLHKEPRSPGKDSLLPAFPGAMVAGRLSRTFPTLPCGGGEARRVGGGLGDDHEPQSRVAVEPVIQTILTLR